MIVVGGEQSQAGQSGLCMLCSYDDSGKKIADWEGHEGDIRAMAISLDTSILVTGGGADMCV